MIGSGRQDSTANLVCSQSTRATKAAPRPVSELTWAPSQAIDSQRARPLAQRSLDAALARPATPSPQKAIGLEGQSMVAMSSLAAAGRQPASASAEARSAGLVAGRGRANCQGFFHQGGCTAAGSRPGPASLTVAVGVEAPRHSAVRQWLNRRRLANPSAARGESAKLPTD